jgi:hypothetical protein
MLIAVGSKNWAKTSSLRSINMMIDRVRDIMLQSSCIINAYHTGFVEMKIIS